MAAAFVAPSLQAQHLVTPVTAPVAPAATATGGFPRSGAAAAAAVAGALVARSVGGQRRKVKQNKLAKVQCKASTLDQLKEVTGQGMVEGWFFDGFCGGKGVWMCLGFCGVERLLGLKFEQLLEEILVGICWSNILVLF